MNAIDRQADENTQARAITVDEDSPSSRTRASSAPIAGPHNLPIGTAPTPSSESRNPTAAPESPPKSTEPTIWTTTPLNSRVSLSP